MSLYFSETPSWCLNECHVHDVLDEMFKKIPDVKYKHFTRMMRL